MIGRGKRVTARYRIDYFLIFDNQRKYEIKTQWTGTFMLFAIQETSGCLSDFFVMRHSYFLMSVKHDSSCWKLYDTLIILKLIDIYGWFRESIPNQTNMYAARVLSPHTWHCSTSLKRDVLCFFLRISRELWVQNRLIKWINRELGPVYIEVGDPR